jgi:hypothetical protein
LTAALVVVLIAALGGGVAAQETPAPVHPDHAHDDHGEGMGGMEMSAERTVMNQNTDRLPRDCAAVSQDVNLTVHAGKAYAAAFPGTMYAYDAHEWDVPACARVTVSLVNDDHVRHQWMVHGLPRYLYPQGMFHLEVSGGSHGKGTFIVPSAKKTYLVHCDVPQHAEKGMKAELQVAGGDGHLPGVPGVSAPVVEDAYAVRWGAAPVLAGLAALLAGAMLGVLVLRRVPER